MLYPKQYVVSYISKFVRPARPDLEAPLLAALDSLDAGISPSTGVLQSLVNVASSPSAFLFEIGTSMLGEFAEIDSAVLDAVFEMSMSTRSRIRHNALLCLTANTPAHACIGIIQNALNDKSSLVRGKAADSIGRLKLHAVLPDLCKAESVEHHQKTREVMNHELRLLRDGYVVEPLEEHESSVTINTASGRVSKILGSETVENDGITSVVAAMSGTA